MSAALAIALPIVLSAAKKIGAPLIKSILEPYIGKTGTELAGTLAETVLTTVAEQAGVPTEKLPKIAGTDLAAAVTAAEAVTPELLAEWNTTQKQTHELLLAEMAAGKEQVWTWAWRPFWMWLLAFFWTWSIVLLPVVVATTGANIPSVDLMVLMTLTTAYLALYMGGHTIKSVFSK